MACAVSMSCLEMGLCRFNKSLALTGFGINCEEEMAAAYKLAGANVEIVHLNEILHGKISIHDYDILNFPGGFSFGDDYYGSPEEYVGYIAQETLDILGNSEKNHSILLKYFF